MRGTDTEHFRTAMRDAGLEPPEVIEPDGKIHRFSTNGNARDTAGWYVFYGDDFPAGALRRLAGGTLGIVARGNRPDPERDRDRGSSHPDRGRATPARQGVCSTAGRRGDPREHTLGLGSRCTVGSSLSRPQAGPTARSPGARSRAGSSGDRRRSHLFPAVHRRRRGQAVSSTAAA